MTIATPLATPPLTAPDWRIPQTLAEWREVLSPFRLLPPPTLRNVYNDDLRVMGFGPDCRAVYRFLKRCGWVYVSAAGWVHILPDVIPPADRPFFWAKAFIVRYADLLPEAPLS